MLNAPCILVVTKSGFSARIIASQRPEVPVMALTDSARTYRQMALVWGTVPELVHALDNYDDLVRHGLVAVQRRGFARPGDRVLVTAGVPFGVAGRTNQLKVETV